MPEAIGEGEAATRVRVLESELVAARQAIAEKESHATNWKLMAEQSEGALETMRQHAKAEKEKATKVQATIEAELAAKRSSLEQVQAQLDEMTKTCKGLERELDDAKQQSESRNGGLENRVTQVRFNHWQDLQHQWPRSSSLAWPLCFRWCLHWSCGCKHAFDDVCTLSHLGSLILRTRG